MNVIRYLIYFPIMLLSIAIVYWGFGQLLLWYLGLSKFWMIFIFIFLGSTIWGFFKGLSSILMSLTSKISPSSVVSFWSILIISLINGINAIYNIWTIDIEYSGKIIFGAIVFTILILELTFAMIYGSMDDTNNYY